MPAWKLWLMADESSSTFWPPAVQTSAGRHASVLRARSLWGPSACDQSSGSSCLPTFHRAPSCGFLSVFPVSKGASPQRWLFSASSFHVALLRPVCPGGGSNNLVNNRMVQVKTVAAACRHKSAKNSCCCWSSEVAFCLMQADSCRGFFYPLGF